ncbi:hypothetical protein FI667_g9315, partial [Globisporangium splendens]
MHQTARQPRDCHPQASILKQQCTWVRFLIERSSSNFGFRTVLCTRRNLERGADDNERSAGKRIGASPLTLIPRFPFLGTLTLQDPTQPSDDLKMFSIKKLALIAATVAIALTPSVAETEFSYRIHIREGDVANVTVDVPVAPSVPVNGSLSNDDSDSYDSEDDSGSYDSESDSGSYDSYDSVDDSGSYDSYDSVDASGSYDSEDSTDDCTGAGKSPMSVVGAQGVFCVTGQACVASINGACPGPQDGLEFGSTCVKSVSGVWGCQQNTAASAKHHHKKSHHHGKTNHHAKVSHHGKANHHAKKSHHGKTNHHAKKSHHGKSNRHGKETHHHGKETHLHKKTHHGEKN